jgi:anti-sigma B factor antagonist
MNMKITTRESGDVTIVDLRGRLVAGAEGAALRRQVRDLLHEGKNKLLLNVGQVDFIDSSGLGELVNAFSSVQKQGGELKLLNLAKKSYDLLRITKLHTFFEIMDDEASAVKSFNHSTPDTRY